MNSLTDALGCLLGLLLILALATAGLILAMLPFVLAVKFWEWVT